jgi:hypothetical protein
LQRLTHRFGPERGSGEGSFTRESNE